MKILFYLLFISCAFAQHHHDMPSTHGMVILGKEKVYLYHLPMFHDPHDYQVILEVTFDKQAAAAYNEMNGFMTLVPEKFSLPEIVKNPKAFKARLFSGHFERGGTSFSDATVSITKVILFRKLNPEGERPESSHYFLFGNRIEQFMAHKISARPDFDHLLSVKTALTSDIEEKSFKFPDTQPATAMGEEIYFETGDLSH